MFDEAQYIIASDLEAGDIRPTSAASKPRENLRIKRVEVVPGVVYVMQTWKAKHDICLIARQVGQWLVGICVHKSHSKLL